MESTKCVLVVDDDESTRELLQLALSDQGYSVVGAVDGATALQLLGDIRPDLILLDIRMPVMDGEAFLDAYSKLPSPHAPIIVLSAVREFFDSTVFESKGALAADAYLKKPFDLNELYSCIKQYAGEP
jgi:two-component system response regulator ResD